MAYKNPSPAAIPTSRALPDGGASIESGTPDSVEALAFLVLTQAVSDMDKDLKMIMAEIKATAAVKQMLRCLLTKVNKDVANNAGQKSGAPPLKPSPDGLGSIAAYSSPTGCKMPMVDLTAAGGVKEVGVQLCKQQPKDIADLRTVQEDLKGKLDSMNEMSEMTSLRLQMMMERRSKFMSTLSNIMKKMGSMSESVVQNIK
jgi:hypothetical protein